MSMKKILAAVSASVVAVSTLSVVAFADETYTMTIDYVDAWTDFKLIDETTSLQGDLDKIKSGLKAEEIESVTFTANDAVTEWTIGYNATDGWKQGDSAEIGGKPAGFMKPGDSVTISDIDWSKGDELCVKVSVNAADDDAAVTVTVKTKAAGGSESTSTPAPANSTADGDKTNVPTGVEGVAAVVGVAAVAAGALIVAKKRK